MDPEDELSTKERAFRERMANYRKAKQEMDVAESIETGVQSKTGTPLASEENHSSGGWENSMDAYDPVMDHEKSDTSSRNAFVAAALELATLAELEAEIDRRQRDVVPSASFEREAAASAMKRAAAAARLLGSTERPQIELDPEAAPEAAPCLTAEEERSLLAEFEKAGDRFRETELGARAFRFLVFRLCKQFGHAPPSERDLDTAFKLAKQEENNNEKVHKFRNSLVMVGIVFETHP